MATDESVTTMAREAWLEEQFNNRARVPEHPAFFRRWAESSASVRGQAALASQLDVQYGPGPSETLDVFGAGGKGKPILVFIHGGWWRSLDKSDHSFIAPAFTAEGAIVVVPNYALCPSVTIGDIAMQMARAMAYVLRHASSWGGDPQRIVVAGHSAGGHLAAMLLCGDWSAVESEPIAQGMRGVRYAVSISGLSDLSALRDTPSLQKDLRLSARDASLLSPAEFPAPVGSQLAAFVGGEESEEFLRQNALFSERWGVECVPVTEVLSGQNHFSILDELASPEGRIHRQVTAWLMP